MSNEHLEYLSTHNKNLTKKQYFHILDLIDDFTAMEGLLKDAVDCWGFEDMRDVQVRIAEFFKDRGQND